MTGVAALNELVRRREPSKFPYTPLDLYRAADSKTVRLMFAAVLTAWLPAAVLSGWRGAGSLESFFLDFAAQSRFFLVVPILILAEQPLVAWLEAIAAEFVDTGLIADDDCPRWRAAVRSFQRRSDSVASRVVMILLVFSLIVSAKRYLPAATFLSWCYGTGSAIDLSPAGFWYAFAVLPFVLFLVLRWLWRQALWTWLLYQASELNLRLVPAHPDSVGGMSFVGYCVWGCLPFSFVVGTLIAGGVANRVILAHQSLATFRYVPLFVIAVVLLICVGPLSVFTNTLLQARRRGVFEYGSLATALGHQFERKWLHPEKKVDVTILERQDFSATTDLYQIVGHVHRMNSLPVKLRGVIRLIVSALVPAVPIVLAVIPFDEIVHQLLRLLV